VRILPLLGTLEKLLPRGVGEELEEEVGPRNGMKDERNEIDYWQREVDRMVALRMDVP